jgi:hypothetical protein
MKEERRQGESMTTDSVLRSDHTYIIFARREKSQFGQKHQAMRCRVLEAHRNYLLVESLKRYNQKYAGANKATVGKYKGIPVRRVNKDQALVIVDEKTDRTLSWETVRRREGTSDTPGRARGGK